MKLSSFVLLATWTSTTAFQGTNLPSHRDSRVTRSAYVPDGFTKESYAKFKAQEARKKQEQAKKNLGRMGPKGFQSRSFQSFQEALEKGEASHLMPEFNAKERVKKGELKVEDIPYMQRGGNWDNSDVKGAKKAKWLSSDKDYAGGGFRKEQSTSIFGYGAGLDWTGQRSKTGPQPVASTFDKKYKAPNIKDIKKNVAKEEQPRKKGFFGLF
mmetsp:Transcript_24746/g.36670  ORF Transcript_24746/g.36670 Transcript_24746/m.36670 type:complete len:212 (-) Transcript_24746:2029-2664(-)